MVLSLVFLSPAKAIGAVGGNFPWGDRPFPQHAPTPPLSRGNVRRREVHSSMPRPAGGGWGVPSGSCRGAAPPPASGLFGKGNSQFPVIYPRGSFDSVDLMRTAVRLSCFHSSEILSDSGALLASAGRPPHATRRESLATLQIWVRPPTERGSNRRQACLRTPLPRGGPRKY